MRMARRTRPSASSGPWCPFDASARCAGPRPRRAHGVRTRNKNRPTRFLPVSSSSLPFLPIVQLTAPLRHCRRPSWRCVPEVRRKKHLLERLKTQSIFFSVTPLLPVKWRSSRSNNSAARAIIHKRIGVCESPREDLSRAQNFMSKLGGLWAVQGGSKSNFH